MGNNRKFASLKSRAIPIGIFALALAVRVTALGGFATVDEPSWVHRSRQFAAGLLFADYECPPAPTVNGRQFATSGWGCTFQVGHPGVTTMWGGSLGLLAYYWQAIRPTGVDVRTFLQDLDPLDPALIAASRLPMAVVAALFVCLFYLLLRRSIGGRVALVSTLLLALDPFHIALSRVLHHDMLAAAFMVLSLLAMVGYWLRGWRWYWLPISAAMAGLAFLTKPVGWFLMPYVAVLGLLSLFYRRQNGRWRGWLDVGQLVGEGVLWSVVAWLTFAAFFPAMWVIPTQTVRGIFEVSTQYAREGHADNSFFLGRISPDPGPLFYPIGWLLRASPLEVLGLLVLPVAVWRSSRLLPAGSLRQQVVRRPVQVALTLFLGMFLLFETAASKKMVRYFLPAFPVIDVFVALGLLWLWDNLTGLFRHATITQRTLHHRWGGALLSSVVLLVQGWLVLGNYPYYFTYYNPLLGGAPGAARLMTVGWGEGMNEAADYLNQQPEAESLHVQASYLGAFIPFFVGEADEEQFSQASEVMEADYVVYYINHVQRRLLNEEVWRYLEKHHTPAHRVTLNGLDYVLIYRNPIDHPVPWQYNSLPDTFTTFGYNLATDGTLTLFWQNLGLEVGQELWAGLAAATGGETRWAACAPAPAFDVEADIPGAILEGLCPLAEAGFSSNLYDLRLGLSDGTAIAPIGFPAGWLALTVDSTGRFASIDRATALEMLIERGLVTPLDISFGDTARLVGYQFESATWQPGGTGGLRLYWELNRSLDLWQVDAFQLVLRLSSEDASEPTLRVTSPVLPQSIPDQNLSPGTIVPVRYPLPLPETMPSGEYWLDVCLTVAGSGQPVAGIQADTSEPIECLSLSTMVNSP